MSQQFNVLELKDTIQDSNINFLIGSGISSPFFELLGNIEILLTELSKAKLREREAKIIEASLYKKYFDGVIKGNLDLLKNDPTSVKVLDGYKRLFQSINAILLNRYPILGKQVNIFTTNIDIFEEKAMDSIGVECNDGFCGRFNPTFGLGNFKKSCFRKSLHYDNTSEIPVFNLIKLHGSVSWKMDDTNKEICFSHDIKLINKISKLLPPDDGLIEIKGNSTIASLNAQAKKIQTYHKTKIKRFLQAYKELLIINPTKEKFKDTLFNQTYYDMLRIYSNELEKENTVLFVMGFSFEDEHIRDLTIRVAESNPTLTIFIIAHTSSSLKKYQDKLKTSQSKNRNIKILVPPKEVDADGTEKDAFEYTLDTINQNIFDELLTSIHKQDDQVTTEES